MDKLLTFFKKAGVTFYIGAVAAIVVFMGMVMLLISNGINGYTLENSGLTIAFSVITLLLAVGLVVCALMLGEQNAVTAALRLVFIIFSMTVVTMLILSRAMLFSALISWDEFNTVGWEAFNSSLASIILYLISVVAFIVCAFFKGGKIKG